jgi:hypothetical protein
MSRAPSHSTPTVTTPRVIRQTLKDNEPHLHQASPYPVYADSTQHSSPPSAPTHGSPKMKGEHVDVDMDIEMLLDRREPSPSSRFYNHNRSEYAVSIAPPSTPPAPPQLKMRVEEDVDVDADLDLLEAVDAAEASRTP